MIWMRRIIEHGFGRIIPAPKPWDGERVDVDIFWAEAWTELKARQDRLLKELQLGDADWSVDQGAGLIHFERKDGALLRAPVQIIGTWNAATKLFTWGWDHPSVQPRLRMGAERTRWFGDKHNLPELTARQIKASESDAWRLSAVCLKINGGEGVYRGPTDENGPYIFMTLSDVKVQQ